MSHTVTVTVFKVQLKCLKSKYENKYSFQYHYLQNKRKHFFNEERQKENRLKHIEGVTGKRKS